MSNGFIPRRKPTISIDPKRMGSFDRIGAVPSSRGGGGVGRLRDLILSSSSSSSWGYHFSHHDGKGSRSVALLAAALVVTVLVCFGMFGAIGGGNAEARHVVVFDAGSTGNRVHVFEFDTTGDGPRLVQEVFHAAKPGLKERANDPRAAAALLDPLVATAMAIGAGACEETHAADAEGHRGAAAPAGGTRRRRRMRSWTRCDRSSYEPASTSIHRATSPSSAATTRDCTAGSR